MTDDEALDAIKKKRMEANKPRRDPLAKERFMEGIRQKWSAVYLVFAVIVMACDVKAEHLDPTPYLSFLSLSYPFLLGGLTVSSYNKEKASMFGMSSEHGSTVTSEK